MRIVETLPGIIPFLTILTIQGSVCAIVILIAQRLFRRVLTPRWRHRLWILLMFRALLPFSLPVAIYPSIVGKYTPTSFISFLSSKGSSGEQMQSAKSPEGRIAYLSTANSQPHEGPRALSLSTGARTNRIFLCLSVIWFVGFLGTIGTSLHQRRKLIRAVGSDIEIAPIWVQELFHDCRQRLGIRKCPVLVVSSGIQTPCLLGALRPRILVPREILNRSDHRLVRHIFLHELAHLKRGDIWLSWLWTFILGVHWFNPFLQWVERRRILLDREYACDQEVLDILEVEGRPDYGHSLLSMAQKFCAPIRGEGVAALTERAQTAERRITMIATYQPKCIRHSVAGILLVLLVGGLVTTSIAQEPEKTLTPRQAELMGRVEHFFLHNFRDVTLRKSIEWGDPEIDENGHSGIRYKYLATIWDREKKMMNQVFTFDASGMFVQVEDVKGFPEDAPKKVIDTSTDQGMKELVEDFFTKNYRDITSRETVEWGHAGTDMAGNRFIRYKFEGAVWGKDKRVFDQVFTFNPEGNFVGVENAGDSASEEIAYLLDISSPEATVIGFTRAAAQGKAAHAQAYFLPGGTDYEDIEKVLTAKPSSSAYRFREMMEAIDPEAPIKLISQHDTEHGRKVVWQITFKKGLDIKGQQLEPGTTFELDATLRKTEKGWLIDNF